MFLQGRIYFVLKPLAELNIRVQTGLPTALGLGLGTLCGLKMPNDIPVEILLCAKHCGRTAFCRSTRGSFTVFSTILYFDSFLV